VFPAFLLVVAALTRDRACFDRYHLLPMIETRTVPAWAVAAIYTAGHAWLICSYGCVITLTGTLLPSLQEAKAAIGRSWPKIATMLVVFLIEYAPAALWKEVAQLLGACS
jgi:hypothetical protein